MRDEETSEQATAVLSPGTGIALARGLSVDGVSSMVTELALPALPDHAVLVNVGPPYRLEESLGDGWRRTPGAPGDVAVVPAGMTLSVRSVDGSPQQVRSLVVRVAPEALASVLEAGGFSGATDLVPALGVRSAAVSQVGRLMHLRLADDTDLGRLSLAALGHALAVALAAEHSAAARGVRERTAAARPRLTGTQVQRVLRHVEENLDSPLRLEDLAALVHLSPFHFARSFRNSVGASPHQYVVQRRTARAQALLLTSGLPLDHIAQLSGFADQSHLSRHVKRQFGMTPGEIRRSR
ncbi:helix-turn-helix domain-containing protein [Blastococcus deserti]|uniref:Helix-turn-helix domain-containing protein n=1 Tax=Blastococcus deserti TaxID=2259033 RepID=A0ABW4X9H0_9ACTN